MTLYATNSKRELHIKLTKADIAGLISVKYGCAVKPEDVKGFNKKTNRTRYN